MPTAKCFKRPSWWVILEPSQNDEPVHHRLSAKHSIQAGKWSSCAILEYITNWRLMKVFQVNCFVFILSLPILLASLQSLCSQIEKGSRGSPSMISLAKSFWFKKLCHAKILEPSFTLVRSVRPWTLYANIGTIEKPCQEHQSFC